MNSLMCESDSMPKPVGSESGKKVGPSVYLTGEQVTALFGKDTPKVGENYSTDMEFAVKSVTKREDGLDVQIELVGCESCEGAEETEAEVEDKD